MENKSELNLPVKEIYIFDAEPGMTIAQDILSQDGSLIAKKRNNSIYGDNIKNFCLSSPRD